MEKARESTTDFAKPYEDTYRYVSKIDTVEITNEIANHLFIFLYIPTYLSSYPHT